MPPAIIGAVVAGAATIGGAALGAKSQKSAAKSAAQTAENNTAANNALARETRAANEAIFRPYLATGQGAMGQLNALLGITPQQQQPVGLPSQTPGQQMPGQMPAQNGLPMPSMNGQMPQGWQQTQQAPQAAPAQAPGAPTAPPNFQAPPAPGAPLQSNVQATPPGAPQALTSQQQTQALSPAARLQSGVSYQALGTQMPGYAGPMQSNVDRANPIDYTALRSRGEAMNPGSLTDFTKSSGYNFRVGEGNRNILANRAATGSVQSGAALKELQRFGQGIASEERQNWVGERDRYIGYNDAIDRDERGYRDNLAQGNRAFAFDQGRYLDQFGAGERGYADQRAQYLDQFNRGERDTRNALGMYGDQFNSAERAFQTGREDYGRSYLADQQRYADQFGINERQYADQRGDYGRAYNLDLGRYQDVFAQGERGYADSRGDYNRAYTDSRWDNYVNQLLTQQGVGLTGASALAGVSNNYLANVTANNNNAASAAANAALARGQATQNMWAGIAGGVGNALGAYQYGQTQNKLPGPYGTPPVNSSTWANPQYYGNLVG
jgi:hypothetical protein